MREVLGARSERGEEVRLELALTSLFREPRPAGLSSSGARKARESRLGRVAGHVVAMGGGGFMADRASPLDGFMLSLSDVKRPRVCFLPTPAGDSDRAIAAFFEAFAARRCEPSCIRLFGMPERPAEHLADTGRDLRLRREHGERARALAATRNRRRPAREPGSAARCSAA